MDNNWIDSLSEEEAGAAVKFMSSGMDSLSEAEAGLLIPHIDKLRAKKPQKPVEPKSTIDDKLTALGEGALGAAGGLATSAVDVIGGIPKFIGGEALKGLANAFGVGTPEENKHMVPQFLEETFPSQQSRLEKGVSGNVLKGVKAGAAPINTFMEGFTQVLEAPGKGVKAVSGSDRAQALTDNTVGLLAAFAPFAKGMGKTINPTRVAPEGALKVSPLIDTPLSEKTGLPFKKTDVPTNFKGDFANIRARNKAQEDLAKEDEVAKAKQPVPEPVTLEPNLPLPELKEAPPLVPDSWKEGMQPQARETPLPVLPDTLKPLSEQYPQGIDIGAIEGGVFKDNRPLPELPPQESGLLSLVEKEDHPVGRQDYPANAEPFPDTPNIPSLGEHPALIEKRAEIERAWEQKKAQEQAESSAAKEDAFARAEAEQAPLTLEPGQGTSGLFGFGKPSPLGGVGKKQGGAIGFKRKELVSPDEIMSDYKEATGKDLPVERAVAKAREINTQFENVKTKVKPPSGTGSVNNLNEKLGNPFTSKEPLTVEEAKIALATGLTKDVDTNFLKKSINIGARLLGSTYGIRQYYNNPILEAVMRPISRAIDAAEYRADHLIGGTEGVQKLWKNLNEVEYSDAAGRLIKYEGTDTPFEKVTEGLNPNQVKAITALRKAQEADLAAKNAMRAAIGKKPLTPRGNYLAGSWMGDRVFHAIDSEGQIRAVVTGFTKDLDVAREYITREHPDWEITPEVSNIKLDKSSNTSNLAELYDSLLKASENGEISIQEKLIQKMQEARDLESSTTRGVHLHEKYKKEQAVLGAQGFKPWLEKSKNAEELLDSQFTNLRNSIFREELDKASRNLEAFEKELGSLNAIKIARDKLADVQGRNNFVNSLENKITKLATDVPQLQPVVKWARKGDLLTTQLMNIKFFALNAMNMLIDFYDISKLGPMTVHGLKEVHGLQKAAVTYAAPLGAWAAMKQAIQLAAIKGGVKGMELTGESKFFHDYAMSRNVGNPTVEIRTSSGPKSIVYKSMEFTSDALQKSISVPEISKRYIAFNTLAHTFIRMGLEKEHAADMAHDLVKSYFGDYSTSEAPAVFSRLGRVGMGGKQLRVWLLKEIMNYSSALANGQPVILSSLLATAALVYGVDSVPLFKEMDELLNHGRHIARKMSGDNPIVDKIANMMTPREYLYSQNTDGSYPDNRGFMDKSVEFLSGGYIQGSSAGSTEWRVFPKDASEILVKVRYLMDSGMSVGNAFKEAFKDDPQGAAIVKSIIEPVTPKAVPRLIEYYGLRTPNWNILNENNNFGVKKNISDDERHAYFGGFQPKRAMQQRQEEELQYRQEEGIKDLRKNAREKVKEAFNVQTLDSEAKNRLGSAIKNFNKQYRGSENIDSNLNAIWAEFLQELNFSNEAIRKMETMENPNNNFQMMQFFLKFAPQVKGRSDGSATTSK